MRKWTVAGVAWAYLFLLFVGHFGERSPYSYGWALFNRPSAYLLGTVVNPDALPIVQVTMFFYEGAAPPRWPDAHNLRLSLHSFVAATLAGYTRSYLLANYLANLLFAMLFALVAINYARRHALRWPAMLVALLTFLSLPLYATYIGQPMHYMVGTAISFLVVLGVAALSEDDVRNPLISGVATAVLTLNYDPYVYAGAVALYVLFVVRFRRARDYALYLLIAVAPVVIWDRFLHAISDGHISRATQIVFIEPVMKEWLAFLRSPIDHALLPFVASHIGIHIGVHHILAMIYWPLVAALAYGLLRLRPQMSAATGNYVIALLPAVYALHQIATAAFDWENNPRRALGVVLAFGYAYSWLAHSTWSDRRWRTALIALMAFSAVLAFADTLLRNPAVMYLQTGQAIQYNPKEAVQVEKKLRLRPESMPSLMADREDIVWRDLGKARGVPRGSVLPFVFAQVFNAFFCVALFWILARAELLPRFAPWMAAAVWLLSGIRFL